MKNFKQPLVILFILLYICTMSVSLIHAIDFFIISNSTALTYILAATFEIGLAATLLTILKNNKNVVAWMLLTIFTLIQVIGNVYSCYLYICQNSSEGQMLAFTQSIVSIFFTDIDVQSQKVFIAYISGAILPIVTLLLTAVARSIIVNDDKEPVETIQEKPVEQIQEKPNTTSFSSVFSSIERRLTNIEEAILSLGKQPVEESEDIEESEITETFEEDSEKYELVEESEDIEESETDEESEIIEESEITEESEESEYITNEESESETIEESELIEESEIITESEYAATDEESELQVICDNDIAESSESEVQIFNDVNNDNISQPKKRRTLLLT